MGAIEDLRKLMHDFLAPELRAIEQRLLAIENSRREFRADVRARFDKADVHQQEMFERLIS